MNPVALDGLVEDLKKFRLKLSSKPPEEALEDAMALFRRVNNEGYKATKTILLLKPEKSVTAEKAYEELSLLLADFNQGLILDREKGKTIRMLDLVISKMARLKILLHRSFESPNPVLKRIMDMRTSELGRGISSTKTTKVKKRSIYTQSKITSFTSKGD
ncbi:MAG: hypothetical protein HXX80_00790 [Nitrososphaerales archaeon]|nr:hypothetical protein [Nitrososphaerales archaeon]